MAAGDIYRLNILWETQESIFFGENVLHYQQGDGQVEPSPSEDLAAVAREFIVPALAALLSPVFQCSAVQVRGITNPTEGVDAGFTPIEGGLAAGQTYDSAMGPLIHWKTGLFGRSFRGRSFLPPATENVINSGGALDETYRTGVAAAALSIVTIEGTTEYGDWQLGVLSRFSGGAERPTPLFTPVTSIVVPALNGIMSQRRS